MSSKLDLVRNWIDSAWSKPPSSVIEANEAYLAEDFQSLDKAGKATMNKQQYIGVAQLFLSAFTDFKWVASDFRLDGDSVIMSGHFEGRHTGDLDLSAVGVGVVPSSGKMIVWPEASVEYMVEGDKVISEKPYAGASGIEELLAPLGVKLPSA